MSRASWVGTLVVLGTACHPRSDSLPPSSDRGSPAYSSTDAIAPASSDPPGADCQGFGGLIHGATTCVHLDVSHLVTKPLVRRPMPADATGEIACGKDLQLPQARLVLICDLQKSKLDAGAFDKFVILSVDVLSSDGGPPTRIRLDEFHGFYDFINVWVKNTADGADLAIDYGIYE